MFTDLNSPEVEFAIETDICIVGAGAAGISIAREFLNTKISVVLLESGYLAYDTDTQALNKGENTGLEYFPLDVTRLRYFGGTTNHWAGQSVPFDPIDFETRHWVADSGWPISYGEYSQYLRRAQSVCKLGQHSFNWSEWKDSLDFPLDEKVFYPVILRFPDPITRFGVEYREEIKNAPNIRCIFNANATNIEVNTEGSVDFIVIKSLKGRSVQIRAKQFILACGAIQNIKLLLNSRNKYPQGLGNEHGLVGKYFMEHPNYDTGEIQLGDNSAYPMLAKPRNRVKGLKIRSDFRLNESLQEKYKILNHTLFFIAKKEEAFGDGLGGKIAKFWSKIEKKVDHYFGSVPFRLRIRLEQAPMEESRVSLIDEKDSLGLSNVKLHFKFSELESRTIRVIQEELAKALGAKNVGRMRIDFESGNAQWEKDVGWQFHHMGGTRMHERPEKGVVDKNCKVHSVDNLYIASSSVFPSGGHANPTMNIIAFALRLADHFKLEMKV